MYVAIDLWRFGDKVWCELSFIWQCGGLDPGKDDTTPEMLKKQMTEVEWQTVYKMSQDKSLYHNLCQSLFPTIHGTDEYIIWWLLTYHIVTIEVWQSELVNPNPGTKLPGRMVLDIVSDEELRYTTVVIMYYYYYY